MIDKFVIDWIAWHPLHDVALGLLVGKRDGRNHVGAEVDAKDGNCAKRQRNVRNDKQQEWRDFRNVAGQRVGD